ncbi:MAG: hypothetical protein CMI52_01520 [Parcubacteria group bacterium]|nr:hypothetical protein [Parcubacteria group bacterium]|tara:strand:+ start:340 stop:675 length:336 start_codon:yes stop_codon:yes gene_type:complete
MIYAGLWILIALCIAAIMLLIVIQITAGFFAMIGSCDTDEYELEEVREGLEGLSEQIGIGVLIAITITGIALLIGCMMYGMKMLIPIGMAAGIYLTALIFISIADRIGTPS